MLGAAAIRAGPSVAIAVGKSLYDTHRQIYQATLKEHMITPVRTEKEHEESTSEQETVFRGRM
ncbi:MAG: hypothetical protein GY696_39830 [Gammaproteobacteria bacterium]|nr:hypothetical protein [Gammaproteobacteria bacterium]